MTIDGIINRERVIVCRFSRESRRGQISCLVKQTNFNLYGESFHSASTPVHVSGLITEMIRNVIGTWADLLWYKCCVVFVQTRYTTLFLGIQKKWLPQCDRNGVKIELWNSCKMSQVTYTVTQSIWCFTNNKAKNVLLVSITWGRDKQYMITLRTIKHCFQGLDKTRERIAKQVGEVLKFSDVMSPARRVAR